jgi:hypothetical protein
MSSHAQGNRQKDRDAGKVSKPLGPPPPLGAYVQQLQAEMQASAALLAQPEFAEIVSAFEKVMPQLQTCARTQIKVPFDFYSSYVTELQRKVFALKGTPGDAGAFQAKVTPLLQSIVVEHCKYKVPGFDSPIIRLK